VTVTKRCDVIPLSLGVFIRCTVCILMIFYSIFLNFIMSHFMDIQTFISLADQGGSYRGHYCLYNYNKFSSDFNCWSFGCVTVKLFLKPSSIGDTFSCAFFSPNKSVILLWAGRQRHIFLRLDRLAAFKIKFADDTRNGIVKRTNLVFGIDQSRIKLFESKTENQSM